MKWYGSMQNRLEENRMFVDEIKVGTGVTEYSYSDRHPYEVIAVKDQKHVTIRRLDYKRIDNNGMSEVQEYEYISNENNAEYECVKRGNYWYFVSTITREMVQDFDNWEVQKKVWFALGGWDLEKIREKGKQTKYNKANISFGHAEYYYDYSF